MRRSCIALLWIVFSSVWLSAQQPQPPSNYKGKSEYDLKNYKADPRDRLIFEVMQTGWLGKPSNIKMDWKSVGFNFAFMFDRPLGKSNFSIGFGAGIYCHNFSSNGDFIYQLDSTNKNPKTVLQPRTNMNYVANRYNERSFEIPIELRFRTKTPTMFKIMVGGKIGWVASDFKKTDDADGRIRVYDIKNVNKLRYGINFRIGFEQICLTACYYFSEVFTKNGPQGILPYSIGIAIIPY
ncbi:MAG: outer membrane beta-barrel protein [Bacteroidia bacterium]